MGIGPADRPESRKQDSYNENKKKEAQDIENLAAKEREEAKETRRKKKSGSFWIPDLSTLMI